MCWGRAPLRRLLPQEGVRTQGANERCSSNTRRPFLSSSGTHRPPLLPVTLLLCASLIHDFTLHLAASAKMWVFSSLQVQH